MGSVAWLIPDQMDAAETGVDPARFGRPMLLCPTCACSTDVPMRGLMLTELVDWANRDAWFPIEESGCVACCLCDRTFLRLCRGWVYASNVQRDTGDDLVAESIMETGR